MTDILAAAVLVLAIVLITNHDGYVASRNAELIANCAHEEIQVTYGYWAETYTCTLNANGIKALEEVSDELQP